MLRSKRIGKFKIAIQVFYTLLVVILSVVAIVSPWWTIKTTVEEKIIGSGKTIFGKFMVTGNVIVSNGTFSEKISIKDLAKSDELADAILRPFNISFTIAIIALGLNIFIFIFIIYATFTQRLLKPKLYKAMKFLPAFLFLIATAYFALDAQPKLTKLPSLFPEKIFILEAKKVSGFWGSIKLNLEFNEWMWGPDIGWMCAFSCFVLDILFSLLIIDKITKNGKGLNRVVK